MISGNHSVFIKILITGYIIAAFAALSCVSNPVSGNRVYQSEASEKLSDAEKRGITRAEADIKSGDLKILYYGEKSSEDDYTKYDKDTGLRMINEEWDDLPSNDYPEEVAAYNRTMRNYVKKQKLLKKSGRGK